MKADLIENNSSIIKIAVSGRIDTNTETELESFIFGLESINEAKSVTLDFSQVEYISSTGLRLLLKLMKAGKELQVINVSNVVYDVFEMTGFTELCTVQKAYRQVDITGCTIIGAGANGTVYRLDSEKILKLYSRPNVLNSIITEKANAKYAFLQGIPTAISFDIVKVGEKFGSIFELLEAKSVASLFLQEPESIDKYIVPYVKLLKTLHSTAYVEREGFSLPPLMDRFYKYLELIKQKVDEKTYESLVRFAKDIPECTTLLHGDCHPFNVMVTKEEMVFIDMDSLSYGAPILDLGALYSTIVGLDKFVLKERMLYKCPSELTQQFWDKTFNEYYKDLTPIEKEKTLAMCKVIGSTQIFAFCIKHPEHIIAGKDSLAKENLQKALDEYFS